MLGSGHFGSSGGAGEISQVRQAESLAGNDLSQPGCAKGVWPHKAAAAARPCLKWQA
jgi:hypothetical protein